ncbi:hypothetical protein [Chitiniphilus shinanonensis]|uniref:hypothetical protein n=1 Tax=Chitiniphilus shinanonensis TaxID=553088 RepID=UPI00303AC712
MKAVKAICAAVSLFAVSAYSQAWDSAASGKISQIDATTSGGYEIRISLENQPNICPSPLANFVYLKSTAANFKATYATLLTAFINEKPVSLYSNKDSAGACELIYVTMVK